MATEKLTVGIFLFDQVEVLDFAGPFEVFSRTRLTPGTEARRSEDSAPFRVFTVAKSEATVEATGGLQVVPAYAFETAPEINLLLVPGGFGTRTLLNDDATLSWIRRTSNKAQLVTSVCTGALLLARAGLLTSRRATTHWSALELLGEIDSTIAVQEDHRVVDDGIVTSAGVSAGIDMSLAVVENLFGRKVADETARYIEYPRTGRF